MPSKYSHREIETDLMGPAQLKSIRHQLGMTQPELATLLRINNKTLRRWERGPENKPIQEVVRFAMLFLWEFYEPIDKNKPKIERKGYFDDEEKEERDNAAGTRKPIEFPQRDPKNQSA